MRRGSLLAAAALLASAALAGAGPLASADARAGELVVFAAASLSDALREIGVAWQGRTGQAVVFSFGASGDLARQIRAGAPAAVFISADAAGADALVRAGLVRAADRVELLSNRLVVVVPAGSPLVLRRASDLAALPRLALADPANVPAGAYARQWLERAGLWNALRERVVPTLDVRAALAAVESGNVPAGVVYATDAALSRRVRVALEVPAPEGPRIRYVAAALTGAGPPARVFLDNLRSAESGAVFRRFGFAVLAAE